MTFFVLTLLFTIVSVTMILIILVQRAQGGGLAGAFGGAGGAGTDTVFGGRVGDALTWATIVAFILYLLLGVLLNRVEVVRSTTAAPDTPQLVAPDTPEPGAGGAIPPPPPPGDGGGPAEAPGG